VKNEEVAAIKKPGNGDALGYDRNHDPACNGCGIVKPWCQQPDILHTNGLGDGATLTIYTDGNIHCRNGSSINSEAPPEEAATLEIYATGEGSQKFDIKAKSDFTGVIYAPDADVNLYAKGNAYGSIVAQNFDFKAGGNFYYDEALSKKNTTDDEAVVFVINRWYESKLLSSKIDFADMEAVPAK
jgi:hypothetical protein